MKLTPLALLITALILTAELIGQDSNEKPKMVIVGFTFGVNASNVISEDNDTIYSGEFKTKSGLMIGPRLFFRLSPYFQIKTGVNYSVLGYQESIKNPFNGDIEIVKTSLHYFQVPITIKGVVLKDFNGTFYYEAGGYYSNAVNAEFKVKRDGNSSSSSSVDDNNSLSIGTSSNDFLRPSDYGVTLGIGLSFKAADVGISYNWGLYNISADQSNSFQAQNRFFQAFIAIKAQ